MRKPSLLFFSCAFFSAGLGSRTHAYGGGELLKSEIQVTPATLPKGLRPARPPRAASQTGSVFLNHHARDVWACDFWPVIDLFFRQVYLFFIVELASRRIVHFSIVAHPTDEWVAQQPRKATPFGQAPRFLIRDRDSKYSQTFKRVAAGSGIEILKTPSRAPKANAIGERFLGSVRRECLEHILVFRERHLCRVIRKYVTYFNEARPHPRIEQRIPQGAAVVEGQTRGKIIAFLILNGLHHDYREAA